MADHMMNRGKFKKSIKDFLIDLLMPDYIMRWMMLMRKVSFYNNKGGILRLISYMYLYRYQRLSIKLGFSIGYNCFGYGLVVPHYGTIVVGSSNRIGNFAVLHTSTCISDNGKSIGDGLYLSTGAKITTRCELGNNVSIGANSVVNKSFEGNCMIAGAPAIMKKQEQAWYERDGEYYADMVKKVESLKIQMGI